MVRYPALQPQGVFLEEFQSEAGTAKGRDMRLEVRHIRSFASWDLPGDVVWLDSASPHKHFCGCYGH
jgi:hypothetical protein